MSYKSKSNGWAYLWRRQSYHLSLLDLRCTTNSLQIIDIFSNKRVDNCIKSTLETSTRSMDFIIITSTMWWTWNTKGSSFVGFTRFFIVSKWVAFSTGEVSDYVDGISTHDKSFTTTETMGCITNRKIVQRPPFRPGIGCVDQRTSIKHPWNRLGVDICAPHICVCVESNQNFSLKWVLVLICSLRFVREINWNRSS